MSKVKKAMITAVCLALCTALPLALRALPGGGVLYAPLLLPTVLCAATCGAAWGALCALAGAALASVVSGVPDAALLPGALAECVCCAVIMGAFGAPRGDKAAYLRLLCALICSRVVGGSVQALLFAPGGASFAVWSAGYFLAALPSAIILLVLVPPLLRALADAGLAPPRDNVSKEKNDGE